MTHYRCLKTTKTERWLLLSTVFSHVRGAVCIPLHPYSYTNDDVSAFMGRCYLLGEELMRLFINMSFDNEETIDIVLEGAPR